MVHTICLRKIADKVASSGYFVVVPDFLHGDPFVPENADRPIQVWIKEHAPGKAFEEATPVIAALKEQGVSNVGAAGYCWGAKVVAELAKANEIQAAVMSHPSFVTVDDIKEVKCPIAILGAENDKTSPPELIKQFEQILSSSNSGELSEERTHYPPRCSSGCPCKKDARSWEIVGKIMAYHPLCTLLYCKS